MKPTDLLTSVADRHGFDGAEMYTPNGWSKEWRELENLGLVTLEQPSGTAKDIHLRYDLTQAGKIAVMELG